MVRNSENRRCFTAVLTILLCSLWINAGASEPRLDYTAWEDYGVVYEAEDGDAYYPSVIFDQKGFGQGAPAYRMWYSDGSGNVFTVVSADGHIWNNPVVNTGLTGGPHHVQVLHEADGFADPSGPRYKIWYWKTAENIYTIEAIGYAESEDGVQWIDGSENISQDQIQMLVTGSGNDWNSGTYGPISIIFQPTAANEGKSPFSYSYVLYYDATNGGNEVTGLAYSKDGLHWVRSGADAVLSGGPAPAWDCSDATYGSVYRDDSGYHYWYSGGGGQGGCLTGNVHEGIGYAFSSDGTTWQKNSANPIFHIKDGVAYRNERAYTPAVVKDAQGNLSMFYSVKAVGGNKKIAMARLFPTIAVKIDIRPGLIPLPGKYKWWRWVTVALLSSEDFDAGTDVARDSLTFGRSGYEPSLRRCNRRLRDLNRDGYDDLICYFDRRQTGFQCGDKSGILRGMTVDGYPLEGTDRVRIFPCRQRQD